MGACACMCKLNVKFQITELDNGVFTHICLPVKTVHLYYITPNKSWEDRYNKYQSIQYRGNLSAVCVTFYCALQYISDIRVETLSVEVIK